VLRRRPLHCRAIRCANRSPPEERAGHALGFLQQGQNTLAMPSSTSNVHVTTRTGKRAGIQAALDLVPLLVPCRTEARGRVSGTKKRKKPRVGGYCEMTRNLKQLDRSFLLTVACFLCHIKQLVVANDLVLFRAPICAIRRWGPTKTGGQSFSDPIPPTSTAMSSESAVSLSADLLAALTAHWAADPHNHRPELCPTTSFARSRRTPASCSGR